MQFAGFRSVIGTMWAVDDGEMNKITSMFYDNMKDECGRPDYTRTTLALNKTMKNLVSLRTRAFLLFPAVVAVHSCYSIYCGIFHRTCPRRKCIKLQLLAPALSREYSTRYSAVT
ncbi:hypothetical protein J3R82DRAFT_6379 [Butyriboletus roseoflavus]|nr:hypothetical protein J3R82DRAFT_6379 [Butyriboletus roseoflavus]